VTCTLASPIETLNEFLPSTITLNVKSLLTSSGSLHVANGHNERYSTPLKQEEGRKF
jgi:hypothetical protein